jgi:hypothetical protein
MKICLICILIFCFSSVALARDYYVSPTGTSTDYFLEDPGSLLAVKDVGLQPGDVVWMRGGTYNLRLNYISAQGTIDNPITFRSYTGEWAIIDTYNVEGQFSIALNTDTSDVILRDFEIFDSSTDRSNRSEGVAVYGIRHKVINLVVHDLNSGVNIWKSATNSEAYGYASITVQRSERSNYV